MNIDKYFYKDRVTLNVLANNIANAKVVYEAAEGHVLIGILSKLSYDCCGSVCNERI